MAQRQHHVWVQNRLEIFKNRILQSVWEVPVYLDLRDTLGPKLGVPDFWFSTDCLGPSLLSDAGTNAINPHLWPPEGGSRTIPKQSSKPTVGTSEIWLASLCMDSNVRGTSPAYLGSVAHFTPSICFYSYLIPNTILDSDPTCINYRKLSLGFENLHHLNGNNAMSLLPPYTDTHRHTHTHGKRSLDPTHSHLNQWSPFTGLTSSWKLNSVIVEFCTKV